MLLQYVRKAQAAGPRTLGWVVLVCGALVCWKATGTILASLGWLLLWRLVHDMVWAYGLPRWVPVLGRRVRGYSHTLRLTGKHVPDMWAMRALRAEQLKRFAGIRRQWEIAAEVTPGLRGNNGEAVPLERLRSTAEADAIATVHCGRVGVTPDKFLKYAKEIKAAIGCPDLSVRFVGVDTAEITFLWTQPLQRTLEANQTQRGAKGQIVYGIRPDGKPAYIFMGLPVLVGGMTGSGKSGFSWACLNYMNWVGLNYDLWASDCKGGAELGALKQYLLPAGAQGRQGMNVRGYAMDVPQTADLIDSFYDAMKARLESGIGRKWTPDMADRVPLMVLLIDETVEVMKFLDKAHKDKLLTCISQCRSAGGMVISLTQMAQKSVLDDMRDMFPQRLSLAQRNAINTNMVLGDDAENDGAACSEIMLPDGAGLGYSYDEARRGYQPFRAGWVNDENMERIAGGGCAVGMGGEMSGLPENPRCAVYRMYNTIGELLYVGITDRADVRERWTEHAKDKPWWGEVCWEGDFKPLVLWYPDRDTALAYETEAEAKEFPRYNEQKNPDWDPVTKTGNPLKVSWRKQARTRKAPALDVVPDGPLEPELQALDFEPDPVGPVQVPDALPEPAEVPEVQRQDETEFPALPDENTEVRPAPVAGRRPPVKRAARTYAGTRRGR
jgi:hypothetical protein